MTPAKRRPISREAHIRAILLKQHGLIATQQWVSSGSSDSALARAAARGELERVLPHVYRSTLVAETFPQRALAAVLWAGEEAVASHHTAVRFYGCAEAVSDSIHILLPRNRRIEAPTVTVHRGLVSKNDRRLRFGVPVTAPARTLVDVAGLLDEESLLAVAEDFFHRGITTPLSVARSLDALGGKGRPGTGRLRGLLLDRGDQALQRRLEVKLWRLLRGAGLRPHRQFEVRVAGKKYFLDFAWPPLKVAVEGHGFGAHGGRIAHVDDSERLANLVGAGWRIIPVTWEAVTQSPDRVIDQVRSALLKAG